MPTCGYICPVCDGTEMDKETLGPCKWCVLEEKQFHIKQKIQITDEEWIESVHLNCSCSDIGKEEGLKN